MPRYPIKLKEDSAVCCIYQMSNGWLRDGTPGRRRVRMDEGGRMSSSQFVRIKSLNTKSMRGVSSRKSVIKVAAMHNLREIQAELGTSAQSGINPARMALNYRIRGCDTAAAVASTAQALLDNADIKGLRKDAIMALEVVFSLPPDSLVDQREFFAAAVAWTDAFFNVPILSAVVHLDEGAPHCHVLLLPLVAGCMRGGTLAGGPSKIKMMHADFQRDVGQRFGLARVLTPRVGLLVVPPPH